MKKILAMLLGLMMFSATALAAESNLCFWTPQGLTSYEENEAAFSEIVKSAQALDGDKDNPPVDENQLRQNLLKAYAIAAGMDVSLGYNSGNKVGSVILKLPGNVFPIDVLLLRLDDVNRLIMASQDKDGKSGLDKIMNANGTINILLADGENKVIGAWQHGMELNKDKNGFKDSKVLILATANQQDNK